MRYLIMPLLVLPLAARAQPAAPPPGARAYWGVRAGTGFAAMPSQFFVQNLTAGASGGYQLRRRLAVQTDALLERRPATEWDAHAADVFLFLPVGLRLGAPAQRVHFVVGLGPTVRLSGRGLPAANTPYIQHNTELTLLHGLELRLLPRKRYETTLALTARTGLTPAYSDYQGKKGTFFSDTSPHREYHFWYGATLGIYRRR